MSGLDLKFLLILIWIFLTAKSAECLRCVQCSSLITRECISGKLAPKNCSTDSKYCTKYEGTVKVNGDKFVTRDCSSEMEKPGCRDKVFYGKEVRVCYSTCETDGCNTASSLSSIHWIVYTISIFFLTSIL